MSEKKLIDWDEFKRHCPDSICCSYYENGPCLSKTCKYWQALPKPTLADVIGERKLDSMTEEEVVEYRASFMENHRQDDTKKEVIEHIKLHIDWDEVPLLEVKWFLEKGFNVFGEGK